MAKGCQGSSIRLDLHIQMIISDEVQLTSCVPILLSYPAKYKSKCVTMYVATFLPNIRNISKMTYHVSLSGVTIHLRKKYQGSKKSNVLKSKRIRYNGCERGKGKYPDECPVNKKSKL